MDRLTESYGWSAWVMSDLSSADWTKVWVAELMTWAGMVCATGVSCRKRDGPARARQYK